MLPPLRALTLTVLAAVVVQAAEPGFELAGIDDLDSNGAYATRGLAARVGERQLVADAGRYDPQRGDLFLTGHVLIRQPGIRLLAAKLGLHLPPGYRELKDLRGVRGDAWEVEAQIETGDRTLRVHAARVELSDEALTFHDVELDMGNGGIVSIAAPTLRVTIRQPKPGEDASDPQTHLIGVALVSPSGSIVGLPVFWLPYLYRDFAHWYPWTRVVFGQQRRLGSYTRFWTGSNLPEIAGWRTGLDGEIADHSVAGWGYGLRPYWSHERFGRGDAQWYDMPKESVRGDLPGETGEQTELHVRSSSAIDAQHQVDLGAGALSARFTRIPGGDIPGTPPDYRYLQDFMPERLEHEPFARQGVAVAYGLPGVTLTVDTERRVNPELPTTERWFGVQGQLHPVELIGPLHLGAESWVEDLHQVVAGSTATRINSRAYLMAGQWFPGGFGADADAGLQELRYGSGEIAGVNQDDAARRSVFSDAGVKLRLAADYTSVTHTFVPRVGVQLVAAGTGDVLPAYAFADGRDTLAEDERYWVAGFDTAVVGIRTLFHASLLSRWAMRQEDRRYTNSAGVQQLGNGSLVDVAGTVDGNPIDPLHVSASFTYDARPETWTAFNSDASWRVAPAFALNESTTLIQDTGEWSHTPGITLYANRYRADASLTFRPGGATIDGWLIELRRRMVEGDLFFGFEFLRDETGAVSDQRFTFGFSLGASSSLDDAQSAAKTGLSH